MDTNSIARNDTKYSVVHARYVGQRKYTLLGKACKSEATAIRRLAQAMITKKFKCGDVLLTADYYEPIAIFEMVTR